MKVKHKAAPVHKVKFGRFNVSIYLDQFASISDEELEDMKEEIKAVLEKYARPIEVVGGH